MLGFHCTLADKAELRTWLLNNNCFTEGPNFLEKHIIFIDKELLINALKDYKIAHFSADYEPSSQIAHATRSRLLMNPPPKNSSVA